MTDNHDPPAGHSMELELELGLGLELGPSQLYPPRGEPQNSEPWRGRLVIRHISPPPWPPILRQQNLDQPPYLARSRAYHPGKQIALAITRSSLGSARWVSGCGNV